MSDFHSELHRAAAPHGEQVARDLTASAVLASSTEGIRRGRRRRTAIAGGAGAVAAVAVVGAGVWLVPSGVWDAEPAAETVNAGPYRYEVGADPEAYAIEEPAVMLRGEDEVMCGDVLDLEPGVTVHDPDAFGRGLFFAAQLGTLGDVIEGEPPATPEPLFSDMPDGPSNDWDPATPQWDTAAGGSLQSFRSASILLDGATVTGVTGGMSGGGMDGGLSAYGGGVRIVTEGHCEEPSSMDDFMDLWNLDSGDPLDSLLVGQFWGGDVRERTLLATIVIDPNEPANTDRAPSPAFEEPEPAPAELREPDGFSYQAFVVDRPEPGCAPLADLRAAGHPSTTDPEYTVSLPVVGELDGNLWGADAVLRTTGGETPWFLERDAWLVADEVSAGIKDPHLEWRPGVDLTLRTGGADPLRGDDCAYVQPIPEIDGAVFLVIDGVEPGGAPEATDEGRFQTWVYLGQAD